MATRRFFTPARALLLCLLLLGGCQEMGQELSQNLQQELSELRKPEKSQALLIAGSSSLRPVTETLTKAFSAKHPGIIIVSEGGGSTAGVMALRRGVIDVAGLSRDVRRSEDAQNIITVPLARNGIGFVVHPTNKVESLTPKVLVDMLTGRTSRWPNMSGASGVSANARAKGKADAGTGNAADAVTVHARQKNSTTLRGVDDLLLHGDDLAKGALRHQTALQLAQAVAADPSALGFVSLADLGDMPPEVQKGIKLVAVDGVPMNRLTLLSGRYPLTRVFYYAMRDDASPVAKQFMDFVMSSEGQNLLRSEGLLTVR